MDTTVLTQLILEFPKGMADLLASRFFLAVEQIWLQAGTYIIGAFVLASMFIILRFIIGGKNIMPSWVNTFVGKVAYLFSFAIIFAISYLFLGPQTIDKNWFAIFGALSFLVAGIFLRGINFWQYKPLPYRKKSYSHKRI